MTDAQFLSRITLLKRLGWLALVGAVLLFLAFYLGEDALHPNRTCSILGAIALVPGLLFCVLITIWHWKARYRGSHSDLWGALLIIETSGWFKILYLFRHIIPDARGTGRYARDVASGS